MKNSTYVLCKLAVRCGMFLLLIKTTDAAIVTVTSTADSGGICPGATCTLRQAIVAANTGDTIDFAPGLGTITLTSDALSFTKTLTIAGPGANLLTIQRSSAVGTPPFRIFYFGQGSPVAIISGLTLANGDTSFGTNTGGNSGGAILTGLFSSVTIVGCNISGNRAEGGGGIFKSGAGGTTTVRDSTISGNTATSSGGGLSNSGSGNFGTLTLENCTITGNVAKTGGAIFNTGVVNLTRSTVANNIAIAASGSQNGSTAGGIYNGGFSTLNATNSTLTGNQANDASLVGAVGGGIYNSFSATVNLSNSTLANNSVSSNGQINDGGGVYNDGTFNSKSSIIAGNTAPRNGPDFLGNLTSQGYNLLGNNANTNIAPATGDQIGNPGAMINPLLGPLLDNGGPVFTRSLLTGSPAIDQGTSNGIGGQLFTDERGVGYRRTVDDPSIPNASGGDGTDIGAFEVGAQINAVSRKLHGGTPYDIALPLAGSLGIECRIGGGATFDSHRVVVIFDSPVTVGSLAVTSAGGQAMGSFTVSGSQVTIDLTAVANAQTLGLKLTNVNDGTSTGDVSVPMGVLLGDTNNSGSVTASDIVQTKLQSGLTLNATNFRTDVNVSGTISASDVGQVKAAAGTSLPP